MWETGSYLKIQKNNAICTSETILELNVDLPGLLFFLV